MGGKSKRQKVRDCFQCRVLRCEVTMCDAKEAVNIDTFRSMTTCHPRAIHNVPGHPLKEPVLNSSSTNYLLP